MAEAFPWQLEELNRSAMLQKPPEPLLRLDSDLDTSDVSGTVSGNFL